MSLRVPHMLIDHVMGSYEDTAANKVVFDVLQYKDALCYEHWTSTDVIFRSDLTLNIFTTTRIFSQGGG